MSKHNLKQISMKPIFTSFLLVLIAFHSTAQEEKKLSYSIQLECYPLEAHINSETPFSCAGQTVQFGVSLPVGQHIDLGVIAGVYFHYRISKVAPNLYLYAPVQVSANFHTKNNRFGVEIATGFPLKLYEYQSYIFSEGFWFKDLYSDNPEQRFQQNTLYKRNNIVAVSNLRFKLAFNDQQRWFFNAGLRLMNYRRRFKEEGLHQPEYVVPGLESYWNISLGLEYRL
jgi:hypothetical protein